jgi:DNA mismatch endonuclease, patch repair protein
MDTVSRAFRSWVMSRVRSENTSPELAVRSLLHRMGFRFRLHAKALPGHPDIVFRSRRRVVLVHGCYWHRHPGCRNARTPRSHLDFWLPKFEANRRRDLAVRRKLRKMGWKVLILWECEVKAEARLESRLRAFLEGR